MDRMNAAWHSVLIGFPVLIVHLGLTTALFLVGLGIYWKVTPFREIELLRGGNIAAAMILSGQMLSLAIPLSAMMVNSVSAPDIVLWGVVCLMLQFIAIACLHRLLPGMDQRFERGEIAPALVFTTTQVVVGLLTAAAVSG
jgi:putative membrane protein